jgi:beta-xylosidase
MRAVPFSDFRLPTWLVAALLFTVLTAAYSAEPPPMRVHDPRIIRSNDWFYLFSTGTGITVWRSHDLASWERDGVIFDQPPAWTLDDFPKGNYLWAPDVTYFGGTYHLYYAASHFGRFILERDQADPPRPANRRGGGNSAHRPGPPPSA